MKVLLIDNHTKHTEDWRQLLEQEGIGLGVMPYQDSSEEFAEQFDVIVLSGGTGMAVPYNREKLLKEIALIKNGALPIIGVCLGFELIADTLGAELKYREARVTGVSEVRVTRPHAMFGRLQSFNAREAHKFYVDELPDELEELARSDSGIEVFAHKTRPLFGLQFHPEIVSADNQGTGVFLNLLKQF